MAKIRTNTRRKLGAIAIYLMEGSYSFSFDAKNLTIILSDDVAAESIKTFLQRVGIEESNFTIFE